MTQAERVLQYIKDFGRITPYDAFRDLAILRLSARIYDLKYEGYDIETTIETAKNRYGEPVHYAVYTLKEKKDANIQG